MSSVITRGNHPLAYVPGARHWYGTEIAAHPKEYDAFLNVVKSDKYFEDYIGSSGMTLPGVMNEGQSVTYRSFQQGITNRLVNVRYSLGFTVSEMAIRDQKDGEAQIAKGTRLVARAQAVGREKIAAAMLDNGFDTAVVQNGGDGKPLFSASHIRADGGTYSNLVTAVDLSETGLENALILLGQQKDDAGLEMRVTAKNLIVSVNDQFNAERILKTPSRVGTMDNDINAIKNMGAIPGGIHVNHFVTDTDAWFITTSENRDDQGLIMQMRHDVEIDADTDFDTKTRKHSFIESYAVGWVGPRAIVGSAGV